MFADGNLTDVLRNMGNDPLTDQKVKKKLLRILASWHAQHKTDPSMKAAANLYKQHKSDAYSTWRPEAQSPRDEDLEAAKRKNKEEARKAKAEAERLKREEKKKRENAGKPKPRRRPFNFEEVIVCSLTGFLRRLAESVLLGETKDPHPHRGCNPIGE